MHIVVTSSLMSMSVARPKQSPMKRSGEVMSARVRAATAGASSCCSTSPRAMASSFIRRQVRHFHSSTSPASMCCLIRAVNEPPRILQCLSFSLLKSLSTHCESS